MKISGSNITLLVNNMDTSCAFYKMLGLKLKKRWDNFYAMYTAPGIVIGLHPANGKTKGSGDASIGFFIKDIDAAEKRLTKNKVKFKSDNGDSGRYIHFKDPDGNILYFTEPSWKY